MHSGIPSVVGFLRFFSHHIKALEMVQIKLLSISPSLHTCFWPPANDCIALHSLNSKYKTYILIKGMKKTLLLQKKLEHA